MGPIGSRSGREMGPAGRPGAAVLELIAADGADREQLRAGGGDGEGDRLGIDAERDSEGSNMEMPLDADFKRVYLFLSISFWRCSYILFGEF